MRVGSLRTYAPHLFVDGEEKPYLVYSYGAQIFCGSHLCSDDAFGIARAAPVDEAFVLARRYMRRHGIHVCREHYARATACTVCGDDVRAIASHFLQLYMIACVFKILR